MKVTGVYNTSSQKVQFSGVTQRIPQIAINSAQDLQNQYHYLRFAKYYEALDDDIYPQNKFIRMENFSFLERIPQTLKKIFVEKFKEFTEFPNITKVSEKINDTFVNNALKTIPQQSTFYKCISDVISWHKQFPDDWKKTWHEIQNKYANEKGCPEGVFSPLDIDAKLNAAYVVLGLLYGNGDFTQTMEISTRAGQDSDCNPASAGGVLGTMLGYDKIPEYWKKGLNGAHDKKFKYTQYSLNDLYNVSFRHALNMIKLNNGKIREKNVRILVQEPETVRFEQCFEGLKLVKREGCGKVFEDSLSFSFEGAGFVLRGVALKKDESKPDDTTRANLYIDGKFIEEASFPTSFHSRRHDLFWNYTLPEGKHNVDIKILTPQSNVKLSAWDYVVYSKE